MKTKIHDWNMRLVGVFLISISDLILVGVAEEGIQCSICEMTL
jgi:hypothetical protein